MLKQKNINTAMYEGIRREHTLEGTPSGKPCKQYGNVRIVMEKSIKMKNTAIKNSIRDVRSVGLRKRIMYYCGM